MMPQIGWFTDWAKNQEQDLWHQGTAITPPATLYLGLSPGDPLRATTPKELAAATSPGYARLATTAADWTTAAGGVTTNATTLTFPANSSGSPWPTAQSMFAADAATGGNIVWACTLAPDAGGLGQAVAAGTSLSFPPGTITITK